MRDYPIEHLDKNYSKGRTLLYMYLFCISNLQYGIQ